MWIGRICDATCPADCFGSGRFLLFVQLQLGLFYGAALVFRALSLPVSHPKSRRAAGRLSGLMLAPPRARA